MSREREAKFEYLRTCGRKATIKDFENTKEQRAYLMWRKRKNTKKAIDNRACTQSTVRIDSARPTPSIVIEREAEDVSDFFGAEWGKLCATKKKFLIAGLNAAMGCEGNGANMQAWKIIAKAYFPEMQETKEKVAYDDYKELWDKITSDPVKPEDAKILRREDMEEELCEK